MHQTGDAPNCWCSRWRLPASSSRPVCGSSTSGSPAAHPQTHRRRKCRVRRRRRADPRGRRRLRRGRDDAVEPHQPQGADPFTNELLRQSVIGLDATLKQRLVTERCPTAWMTLSVRLHAQRHPRGRCARRPPMGSRWSPPPQIALQSTLRPHDLLKLSVQVR